MPRYIDAERFSERFDMMCDAGGILAPVTEAVREMVKKLIKAEPTVDVQSADVEPVRHGQWIDEMVGYVKCSVCNDLEEDVCAIFYNFCPNCGAKMDGGDEDETDV